MNLESVVDKTGEVQQSIEDISKNNCFNFFNAAQFNFCRYETLCPATKTEIHRGSFPRNFAKF